jgi:Subunit ChlI of Mg-chelatase
MPVARFLDARGEVAGPRGCPRREFPDRPDRDRTRCHRLVGVKVSSPTEKLGLPNFTIGGLTDRAIQEARERVRASIRNAGFDFPMRRLTVNLAPAEIPKEGTGFDLTDALQSLH